MTVLVILGVKYLIQESWPLLLQVGLSIVILGIYIATGRKLHQDSISSLFVVLTGILHSLGLYGTHPLGIKFDHYTHFLGAFSAAMVVDRIYLEKLPRQKRFLLVTLSAVGVGAILEILQWVDGYLLPGVSFFQADDISNTMGDMICNTLGGTTMGIVTLLRKETKDARSSAAH
jgi:hypothetical protein